MTGVKTNIVTAVEIHDQWANDGVHLFASRQDSRDISVKEVCGDLAYSSLQNLTEINDIGVRR